MNPVQDPPDNCPNGEICMDPRNWEGAERRAALNEWPKIIVGILATVGLALASGALGWLMNHEHRMTTVEVVQGQRGDAIQALKGDITTIKQDVREDIKEIKADIKVLLERRR